MQLCLLAKLWAWVGSTKVHRVKRFTL